MAENAPPSQDPADDDSLAGVFNSVLTKFLQNVDDMLPAVVVAYDRTKNRASVRPLIMVGTTDGQKITRAEVASVPVLNLGAGGFVLSFPLKPGDLGWIKANDRDISLFLQQMGEEWPNTKRLHKFADGVFIPDAIKGFMIDAEDAERVVLQTTDGTSRISLGSGIVKVVAATVAVEASTTVTIETPTLALTGDMTVTGKVTAQGEVQSGAIKLTNHKHGGVQSGAAQTVGTLPG